MNITYTKVSPPKMINCYEVVFSYEHGDADSFSSNTVILKDITDQFLLEYVAKAEEVAQLVDDSRSYGTKLPKYFSESAEIKIDKYYIPVEYDDYAKMHTSDYYAGMGIEKIFFYDSNGEKFKVNIQDPLTKHYKY